jgi:putative oxidoreductase
MTNARWVFVLARRRAIFAWTFLRMITGGIMLAHGVQKLLAPQQFIGQVSALGIPFPEVAGWLSIAAEAGGGLLLLLGLFTPLAGTAVAINLVVAIVTVHLDKGLFAQNGGFEYPLMLACVALTYAACGAGPLSVDARRLLWREADDQPARASHAPVSQPANSYGAARRDHDAEAVDEAGFESFPASDPPAHNRRMH